MLTGTVLFKPVFVYDSTKPHSTFHARAMLLGLRMVDIRGVETVCGGNPGVVIYDITAPRGAIDKIPNGQRRLCPPKKTGVVVFETADKGTAWGLLDSFALLGLFTGRKVELGLISRFTLGEALEEQGKQ